MKKTIDTWTVSTLKEDIKLAKKSLEKMKQITRDEQRGLFFELLKIDEFVQKFKFSKDKFVVDTKDIEKLKTISQTQKQNLIDKKKYIGFLNENVSRVRNFIKELNEKLEKLTIIENQQKQEEENKRKAEQEKANLEKNSLNYSHDNIDIAISYYKEQQRKFDSQTFDDIIKQRLKSSKENLKKREK